MLIILFGVLIEELKKANLYEDSVILVFGDHAGLAMNEESMEEFIKEENPNYNDIKAKLNYVNLACGIRAPGIENMKINGPISKIDIKPTLLYLSGIENDFSLGSTFFSTKDYAYINNGHIVLDTYYYDGVNWYLIETGEILNLDLLDKNTRKKLLEYSENVIIELDISSSIAINNLLK